MKTSAHPAFGHVLFVPPVAVQALMGTAFLIGQQFGFTGVAQAGGTLVTDLVDVVTGKSQNLKVFLRDTSTMFGIEGGFGTALDNDIGILGTKLRNHVIDTGDTFGFGDTEVTGSAETCRVKAFSHVGICVQNTEPKPAETKLVCGAYDVIARGDIPRHNWVNPDDDMADGEPTGDEIGNSQYRLVPRRNIGFNGGTTPSGDGCVKHALVSVFEQCFMHFGMGGVFCDDDTAVNGGELCDPAQVSCGITTFGDANLGVVGTHGEMPPSLFIFGTVTPVTSQEVNVGIQCGLTVRKKRPRNF